MFNFFFILSTFNLALILYIGSLLRITVQLQSLLGESMQIFENVYK